MHEEIQHVWIINWLRVEQNIIYTNGARGMLIGNVKACMILYVGGIGFVDIICRELWRDYICNEAFQQQQQKSINVAVFARENKLQVIYKKWKNQEQVEEYVSTGITLTKHWEIGRENYRCTIAVEI